MNFDETTMYEHLIATLPETDVIRVVIGLHWTAVVVEGEGEKYCGLASTLWGRHEHHGIPDVPQAGKLTASSAKELIVLERHPRSGDYPETAAKNVIPAAGVVALTRLASDL